MKSDGRDTLLAIGLSCAVPLLIMEFKNAGGPTTEQMQKITSEVPLLLGEHGDGLLNPGNKRLKKKPGTRPAEIFNRTAEAIAALAFYPGGIVIFGMLFEVME